MKLAIGCDEAACDLKNAVKQHLLAQGHEVADFGTHDGAVLQLPRQTTVIWMSEDRE